MQLQFGFIRREACLAAVLGVGVVWDCYYGGFHIEVRAKSSKGLEKGNEFPILEKGGLLMKVTCKNMQYISEIGFQLTEALRRITKEVCLYVEEPAMTCSMSFRILADPDVQSGISEKSWAS